MTRVRHRASVAPSTVTRFSKGEVGKVSRNRRKRGSLLAVADEYAVKVDKRIMDHLHQTGVDFHCVEVVSPTEVIIHNQRVR